ncbi:hypothetical protein Ancab_038854, partial [Ancistrocladus abbreviatus]
WSGKGPKHALMTNDKFKVYVLIFAQEKKNFFESYAIAHQKFSELGFGEAVDIPDSSSSKRKRC